MSFPTLTDRDLIVATFNAVAALARQMTGRELVVERHMERGGFIKLYGDPLAYFIVSEDNPVEAESNSCPAKK